MPRIHYPSAIRESVEELLALERDLRGQPTQARATLLCLLKTGQARTLVVAAPLAVGYGERTVNRWWKTYQTAGLARLAEQRPRAGKRSQLTEIATLKEAQRFLAEQHAMHYQSLGGVW